MKAVGWRSGFGHPEIGELLCYADRSLSAIEQEELAQHLTDCDQCQKELALLESQVRVVSAAMSSIAHDPVSDIRKARAWSAVNAAARARTRRRTVRTVWVPRLAAATVAAVVVGFSAGPVLAFVRSVFTAPEPAPVATRDTISVPVDSSAEAVLSFPGLRGPLLPIVLERATAGSLEFRREKTGPVSVQVTGSTRSSGFAYRGDTIVFANDGFGQPSYVVTIPPSVTRAQIRVGAGNPVVINLTGANRYDLKELSAGRLTTLESRKGG